MQFVCLQYGEALVVDPETGVMLTLPQGRTYPDAWALEPGRDVRVLLAGEQPMWIVGQSPPAPSATGPFLDFLGRHRHDDLVVEFDDGDRYPSASVDLAWENPDGEFEIRVNFADSIGPSHAETVARDAGSPRRSPPGTWWTSVPPSEPVGFTYTAGRVRAIYDEITGLPLYERADVGHTNG
jgi:hypothetical protein